MENYTQIRVLGKGSFGAAWLVKRKKDGAQLVAKEVRLANMKKEEKDAAKHEISMLRSLSHPNITSYVDHFEHKGSLFIVMEFANGGDLYTKVQSRRGVRFSEREVLHYFCQLTLALYHMHEKRVLHRDLKSQNVFLTADGVVKLGDFGISTVLRNTYELKRTVCGTPYYFSPELCLSKPYNNKSDIWALGCILYELTTLNHAFDATSMKALVQKILRGVYPPIHASYSKELKDLIAAMLNIDPTKRPHIAAIVQLPFIRTALELLQREVKTAVVEKRSCVDELDRNREKEEAAARALAEKAQREKKEVEYKAQQEEREKAHQERVQRMRQQMEKEVREHEEKLRRIRDEQKVTDEKRKAEAAERQKRMDEERKLRQRRQGDVEAANRKREEEWERNMKNAEAEAKQRHEAQRQRDDGDAQKVLQQAEAFREAQRQARANKERAMENERREREAYGGGGGAGGGGGGAPPAAAAERRDVKAKAAYDEEQARKNYMEMRREAELNRHRLAGDGAAGAGGNHPHRVAPPEQHTPTPQRGAPGAGGATPPPANRAAVKAPATPEDDQKAAAARAEAFWEMRRAAEENKRRLLGLDPIPAPPNPHAAPAPAAQPPRAAQPAAANRTPPAEPSKAPLVPPGLAAARQTPPAVPTPPPAQQAPPIDDDGESDEDGDVGYHKFLNNDAAGDEEAGHDPNASRQKDYNAVEDTIQRVLNDPNQARLIDEDFGDEPDDAGQNFILDGRTLHLPNTSANDPLGHRIETLRMFLEQELGDDKFFAIYRLLSRAEELDETAAAMKIAGPAGGKYVQLVTQLIVCEEAFSKQQNTR
jgi:NIMA (never in mitosis gene a)-related kinase